MTTDLLPWEFNARFRPGVAYTLRFTAAVGWLTGYTFTASLGGSALSVTESGDDLVVGISAAVTTAKATPEWSTFLLTEASAGVVVTGRWEPSLNGTLSPVTTFSPILGGVDVAVTLVLGPAGAGGTIRVEDEGVSTVATASAVNFAGAGVTVSDAGAGEALVTIPGGGGGGAVNSVTAGDLSITVGGTATDPTIAATNPWPIYNQAGDTILGYLGEGDPTGDPGSMYFWRGGPLVPVNFTDALMYFGANGSISLNSAVAGTFVTIGADGTIQFRANNASYLTLGANGEVVFDYTTLKLKGGAAGVPGSGTPSTLVQLADLIVASGLAASHTVTNPAGASFPLDNTGATEATDALTLDVTGDTNLRFVLDHDGTMWTGNGSETIVRLLKVGAAVTSQPRTLAVGRESGLADTTGTATAFGNEALKANTSGRFNLAVGGRALNKNTTGEYNVAIGQDALFNNVLASRNVAVGVDALYSATDGQGNVAVGTDALVTLTTGDDNVAVGDTALFSATTAGKNTAVGRAVLFNATSADNTGVGAYALSFPAGTGANATTTGQRNTAVGSETGQASATQRNNTTVVGYRALIDGDYATAIGAGASAGAAGAVAIGTDSGGAGAATTTANRIQLGTANHSVNAPGTLQVAGVPVYGTLFARKTADESVTSSAVLQNDDHLLLAVAANATYIIDGMVFVDAGNGDFRAAFTVPASATLLWGVVGPFNGATSAAPYAYGKSAPAATAIASLGGIGAGSSAPFMIRGTLVVAGTAGNLQFQWAQDGSDAVATKVLTNSWIKAERVA